MLFPPLPFDIPASWISVQHPQNFVKCLHTFKKKKSQSYKHNLTANKEKLLFLVGVLIPFNRPWLLKESGVPLSRPCVTRCLYIYSRHNGKNILSLPPLEILGLILIGTISLSFWSVSLVPPFSHHNRKYAESVNPSSVGREEEWRVEMNVK